LKEAYIKMTGEALLANWLRDLEFRNVRPPSPSRATDNGGAGAWGETVKGFEIYRRGERVQGVKVELQAFEEGYMIATSVSVLQYQSVNANIAGKQFENFEQLDLERDVYPAAATNL